MVFIPEFEMTKRQVINDPDVVDRVVWAVFASQVGVRKDGGYLGALDICNPGFFFQLTKNRRIRMLSPLDTSTRQCPSPFIDPIC